ncbi:MAG: glycosyl transferase [Candidatus Pelagibacter sp.]|nr:glycosyl transferase [Candidatus Pelagibacter sp.]
MNKSIQVSVIIAAKNAELYIGRCIRSLINQSFDNDNYEIIVINDGSSDRTPEALKQFMGDIIYIKNKKNIGLPGSLNKGIKKARGQYIVRVDADDWVNPQFLNLLYHHLNLNMELDAVACDYQIVNNQQKILSYENCEKKPIGCGIMFKYSNLIEIGLYDKKFLAREEEELIHRFKKKYKVTRIPVPLYRYRKHENNLTKKKIL